MRVVLVLALMGLAACGADGDPIRPTANASVTIGSDGISTRTGVTIRRGPLTIGIGS